MKKESVMAKPTLRQRISKILRSTYTLYLKYVKKMDIGNHVSISKTATMERANPRGVHIGDYSRISIEAMVLAHDYFRGKGQSDTYIGHHSVIGGRAIVLPGIKIGNHCFIGAGSIVTKDIPDHCLVAGNPAKIVRVGIELNDHYQIVNHGHKPTEQVGANSSSANSGNVK